MEQPQNVKERYGDAKHAVYTVHHEAKQLKCPGTMSQQEHHIYQLHF
jgi:hypothetical protein